MFAVSALSLYAETHVVTNGRGRAGFELLPPQPARSHATVAATTTSPIMLPGTLRATEHGWRSRRGTANREASIQRDGPTLMFAPAAECRSTSALTVAVILRDGEVAVVD
jgi:hypothetical protein